MYDSYGSKCNSRFLLNYGFIQPDNMANETVLMNNNIDSVTAEDRIL